MVKITFAMALVLASVAPLVAAQDAETPACGQTCIVNMIQSAKLGCEAGAMDCLCPQPDFFNGITDCAKESCDDGVIIVDEAAAAASSSAVAMCASATASAAVSSTTDSSITTERPSGEQSPQSTAGTESTASIASADAGPTDDAKDPSDEDDDNKSEGKGKKHNDDDDDEEEEPASAVLSVGAKAGIGAVAGVVAVSLLSLIAFFVMRRRRAARPAANFPRYTISGPMPGGGRDYGGQPMPGPVKGSMSEMDFSARRYEDMLPRVQPASNI